VRNEELMNESKKENSINERRREKDKERNKSPRSRVAYSFLHCDVMILVRSYFGDKTVTSGETRHDGLATGCFCVACSLSPVWLLITLKYGENRSCPAMSGFYSFEQ
jgi:hypothetical protein